MFCLPVKIKTRTKNKIVRNSTIMFFNSLKQMIFNRFFSVFSTNHKDIGSINRVNLLITRLRFLDSFLVQVVLMSSSLILFSFSFSCVSDLEVFHDVAVSSEIFSLLLLVTGSARSVRQSKITSLGIFIQKRFSGKGPGKAVSQPNLIYPRRTEINRPVINPETGQPHIFGTIMAAFPNRVPLLPPAPEPIQPRGSGIWGYFDLDIPRLGFFQNLHSGYNRIINGGNDFLANIRNSANTPLIAAGPNSSTGGGGQPPGAPGAPGGLPPGGNNNNNSSGAHGHLLLGNQSFVGVYKPANKNSPSILLGLKDHTIFGLPFGNHQSLVFFLSTKPSITNARGITIYNKNIYCDTLHDVIDINGKPLPQFITKVFLVNNSDIVTYNQTDPSVIILNEVNQKTLSVLFNIIAQFGSGHNSLVNQNEPTYIKKLYKVLAKGFGIIDYPNSGV